MTQIEPGKDGFVVDADILADAFGIKAAGIRNLMQSGAITSRCEKGADEDEGRWRLAFFHGGRALRLTVDETGRILGRSRFDAPRSPMPQTTR
ncbi:DUF6522 family protein [uncultured Jannaschia sp.]|uniref:DUF6522 family protein n=1 Tax=uncultured Jannaschia sp. TaxID=293347 RepID=UPI00261612BF|nr:DUF6522 family protein [uncultured Jannaschia sp.]